VPSDTVVDPLGACLEDYTKLTFEIRNFEASHVESDRGALNPQDHHFGSLYQSSRCLPGLQLHLPRRSGRDDCCDLLAADGNLDFCHQPADSDCVNSSDQLIATTDVTNDFVALSFGFAARPEQEPVDFRLRNSVMATNSPDAPDLFFVDPLLDCGKADSKL